MRVDEFKFKGIESGTYGLICQTTGRQLLPQMRVKTIAIDGKHGVYDFGNNTYNSVMHAKRIVYVGDDINELRHRAHQIAAWLHSTKFEPLIFGDEPDKFYQARVPGGVNLQSLLKTGECDIVFECQPMADCIASTGEDIILDSDLPLNSDITLDTINNYTFNITGPTTITFYNHGLIETGLKSQPGSKFNIEITGSFSTLSITMNGKTINYNEAASGKIIIDNVNATIKTNGINKISACSGDLTDFFEVVPGVNEVTISGTGLNCSVLFDFRQQYL